MSGVADRVASSGEFLIERTIDLIQRDIRVHASRGKHQQHLCHFHLHLSSFSCLTPPKTPFTLPTMVVIVLLIATVCSLYTPIASLPPLQAWDTLPMKESRIWQ
jgi:hypothetical protein